MEDCSTMKLIAIKIIKFYQYFSKTVLKHNAVPLLFPTTCRFYPTCSDYTVEAILEYGFFKGITKGIGRVFKCNPFTETV